jgi:hypothetical protein
MNSTATAHEIEARKQPRGSFSLAILPVLNPEQEKRCSKTQPGDFVEAVLTTN